MLISEYFHSGIKQRNAVFRIHSYLADKDVDYSIYYNMDSFIKELNDADKLPKEICSEDLKRFYTQGFFRDNRYVLVELEGKLTEYKDIKEDDIYNQNFVDEYDGLALQDEYIESLSELVRKEFRKIQDDEKLVPGK